YDRYAYDAAASPAYGQHASALRAPERLVDRWWFRRSATSQDVGSDKAGQADGRDGLERQDGARGMDHRRAPAACVSCPCCPSCPSRRSCPSCPRSTSELSQRFERARGVACRRDG